MPGIICVRSGIRMTKKKEVIASAQPPMRSPGRPVIRPMTAPAAADARTHRTTSLTPWVISQAEQVRASGEHSDLSERQLAGKAEAQIDAANH